jgi:hypothetical protein
VASSGNGERLSVRVEWDPSGRVAKEWQGVGAALHRETGGGGRERLVVVVERDWWWW